MDPLPSHSIGRYGSGTAGVTGWTATWTKGFHVVEPLVMGGAEASKIRHVVIDQPVVAFYVRAENIRDGVVAVAAAAALPRLDAEPLVVKPGGLVFVIDLDDNIASAVVLDRTESHLALQVRDDWAPMSLADVELRALAAAVHAARRQPRDRS